MQYLHVFVYCVVGFSVVYSMKQSLFKTCNNRKRDLVPFEKTSSASVLQCAAHCLSTQRCTAANFVQDSRVCELLDDIPSNQECDSTTFEARTTFLVMMRPTTADEKTETSSTGNMQSTAGVEITQTSSTENTLSTSSDNVDTTRTTERVIQCQNNQTYDGSKCMCEPPLTGEFCENGPRDCHGITSYSWLTIYPEDGKGKITIFCGTNYLYVIATNFAFSSEYLNRTWLDYKMGFGDIPDQYTSPGGYWLGNENIHRITNGTLSYKLNFYGHVAVLGAVFGDYMNFRISSETEFYTETYTSYSSAHNIDRVLDKDRPFITYDRDENGCAALQNTGFWFDAACILQPPLFANVRVNGNKEPYENFWVSLIRI